MITRSPTSFAPFSSDDQMIRLHPRREWQMTVQRKIEVPGVPADKACLVGIDLLRRQRLVTLAAPVSVPQ